jgi:DNA-binding PadR family transcriptional regulator
MFGRRSSGPGGRSGGFGKFGAGFGFMAARNKGKLLTSDELQLIVLHLVSEKPRHGYEIIKVVEELSSGMYVPSPGMIYPALTYLEEAGLAVSEADGAKKLFQVTDAGTAFLLANREAVGTLMEGLTAYGRKMAFLQQQIAQEEMVDERWGDTIKQKMEFQELRLALKSMLFETLGAPPEEKARALEILKNALAEIRKK